MATAARDLNHDLDAVIGNNQSETSDKLKSTMVAQSLINYSDQVGGDELLNGADVYAAFTHGYFKFLDLQSIIEDRYGENRSGTGKDI